jgi:hypothetical protein
MIGFSFKKKVVNLRKSNYKDERNVEQSIVNWSSW